MWSLSSRGSESTNGKDPSSARSSASAEHLLCFRGLFPAQWPSEEQREGQQREGWKNYVFLNRTCIAWAGKDSV